MYFNYCQKNCGFLVNSIKDNCIIFHNSSLVESVECNSRHNAICAFPYLSNNITKTFCTQKNINCVQRDYFSTSECLCLTYDQIEDDQLANFEISYQNLAYKALTSDTCYIGLKKLDHSYIWSTSVDVNYTNWSPAVVYGIELKYGAISPEGWTLSKNRYEYNCSLTQRNVTNYMKTLRIILEYHNSNNSFSIHVTNPQYWIQHRNNQFPEIFCFTDATTTTLYDRLIISNDILGENFANYSIKALPIQSGHYWCEGFVYPNWETISSERYLLR